MDLSFSAEHQAYRKAVATFLETEWVAPKRDKSVPRQALVERLRRLSVEHGYIYRSFPRALGGSEQPADPLRAQIIREEFERVRAPMEVPGNGVTMLAPTLLEAGAQWQQEMFIPPTLTGEYRWAQGYSEPGAGSDLASLTSRAVLSGDEWVINAHKIWTSFAYDCTHMFILVRTEPDAPKRKGISYLLLPLDQPGVTIRRIEQISGQSEFCEVFLEDVRTPKDWIIGARGDGWQVSRTTLRHERSSIGGVRTLRLFEALVRLARSTDHKGRPAIEDPVIRNRIVAVEGYVQAQMYSGYHQLSLNLTGRSPGIYALLNKLGATTIGEEVALIASDIVAARALHLPSTSLAAASDQPERWLNQIFGSLGLAIAGGASNIQRNIIAERGLALPREPKG